VLDIVFGENSNSVTTQSLLDVLKHLDVAGTLYLGYPVLSTADGKVFIDALLLTQVYGLIRSSGRASDPDAVKGSHRSTKSDPCFNLQ
jgi:hypothetical protein